MRAMSIRGLEILEQAEFPPAQARAIVKVIEDYCGDRQDRPATKTELAELKSELKTRRGEVGTERRKFRTIIATSDHAGTASRGGDWIERVVRDQTRLILLCYVNLVTICWGLVYFLIEARQS